MYFYRMKILIVQDEIGLLIEVSNHLAKENYICELDDNFEKNDLHCFTIEILNG